MMLESVRAEAWHIPRISHSRIEPGFSNWRKFDFKEEEQQKLTKRKQYLQEDTRTANHMKAA